MMNVDPSLASSQARSPPDGRIAGWEKVIPLLTPQFERIPPGRKAGHPESQITGLVTDSTIPRSATIFKRHEAGRELYRAT
jgi:hypothetical protein